MPTNYAALIGSKSTEGSIKSWVNHASVPAATIVYEAEEWIYQRVRVRQMQFEASVSFAIGADSLDLTTLDQVFLDPITMTFDGDSQPLDYVHEMHFAGKRTRDADGDLAEGWPSCWSILGDELLLDTSPTEAMEGTLWYYGRPTALATASTNFLTDRYPTLLRHVCMAYGYQFLKRGDDMAASFALAESAISEANISADRLRRGQIL